MNCPHCGAELIPFDNPRRYICPTHGVINGEDILRPDTQDQPLDVPNRATGREAQRQVQGRELAEHIITQLEEYKSVMESNLQLVDEMGLSEHNREEEKASIAGEIDLLQQEIDTLKQRWNI